MTIKTDKKLEDHLQKAADSLSQKIGISGLKGINIAETILKSLHTKTPDQLSTDVANIIKENLGKK